MVDVQTASRGCDCPYAYILPHGWVLQTQAQRDAINDKRKKTPRTGAIEGCTEFLQIGCSGNYSVHATQVQRVAINDKRKKN